MNIYKELPTVLKPIVMEYAQDKEEFTKEVICELEDIFEGWCKTISEHYEATDLDDEEEKFQPFIKWYF